MPFQRYRSIIDDFAAFSAFLDRPLPICIHTNSLRTTPQTLTRWLARDDVEAVPLAWYGQALRLAHDARPGSTMARLAGLFHVQEEAALLPVILLDPQPGERILDLCAAPGNKTAQIALQMGDCGTVVANDRDAKRIGILIHSLERLGIASCAVIRFDAGSLPRAIGTFDRVLADVPCSCEGTSRKHPGVITRQRHGYRPGDLRSKQLAILRKAVQRCRPGGRIVYATCTYAPEENEIIVDEMLSTFPAGTLEILPATIPGFTTVPGITTWEGRTLDPALALTLRVYPHHNDTGGFFIAVLQKGTA